jgi:hypothetical protein
MTAILARLAALTQKKDGFYTHPCDYVVIKALADAAAEIERLTGYLRAARNAASKMEHLASIRVTTSQEPKLCPNPHRRPEIPRLAGGPVRCHMRPARL